MAAWNKGQLIYKIYRAVTLGLSPLIRLHLRLRILRGLEHPTRWPERLGRPSIRRPPGHLLWFHAVSLGEGMAAVPVIKECVERRPDVSILLTTTTLASFEVLNDLLPPGVLYQFSPVDTPSAVESFLGYWKPNAIVILENELWPNLILSSSKKGITLALLNARVSSKSFERWSSPLLLPLVSLMLSKFTLIVPLSNIQAIRLQLLQAPPFNINFAGDLKYAVQCGSPVGHGGDMEDLHEQLADRQVWMAASIHKGEEKVILGVHRVLSQSCPKLVTIIVPRYPDHGQDIAQELQKEGWHVALRSQRQKISAASSIYVVDTLGELRYLYNLSPIAVIGGSFCPGLTGHNLSEAAAAGCAVLTGLHVGHFAHMVQGMQQLNPLSVLQVSGQKDLEKTIIELFNDVTAIEARRLAAKQAISALSGSVIGNFWKLLDFHFFQAVCSNLVDKNNVNDGTSQCAVMRPHRRLEFLKLYRS